MRKGTTHTEDAKRKMSLSLQGRPSWNKGKRGYRAGEKRPGIQKTGTDSTSWKGDEVGYRGLHYWVQFVLGKPEACESCGKKGNGHRMHWANISGEYRVVEDWVRLCPKCHEQFDTNRIT